MVPARRRGGGGVFDEESRRLLRRTGHPALQFTIHSVGVLAAAAGPVDPVVAALARLETALDRWVAQQTGEEYRH